MSTHLETYRRRLIGHQEAVRQYLADGNAEPMRRMGWIRAVDADPALQIKKLSPKPGDVLVMSYAGMVSQSSRHNLAMSARRAMSDAGISHEVAIGVFGEGEDCKLVSSDAARAIERAEVAELKLKRIYAIVEKLMLSFRDIRVREIQDLCMMYKDGLVPYPEPVAIPDIETPELTIKDCKCLPSKESDSAAKSLTFGQRAAQLVEDAILHPSGPVPKEPFFDVPASESQPEAPPPSKWESWRDRKPLL